MQRLIFYLLLVSVNMVTLNQATAGGGLLDIYHWEKRVLLVFAPGPNDTRLLRQESILARVGSGMIDRELVVIRLYPNAEVSTETVPLTGSQANDFYRDFGVDRKTFRVLLVGKDGGLKLSSDQPVEAEELFGLIDSMPMRQWEIRQKRNSAG